MWRFTHIEHAPRLALGLTVLEYAVFDIVYNSQTHPDYSINGYTDRSYKKIADFLGISKGAVHKIIDNGVKWGLMEVNPANPRLKKTTPNWYDIAYLVYQDQIAALKVQKVKRSKNERSKNERQNVHILNDNVHNLNAINKKSKLSTKEHSKYANLPDEERIIRIAMDEARDFFLKEWPAMRQVLSEAAKFTEWQDDAIFYGELDKWIRHNGRNRVMLSRIKKNIPSSFGRWLMNINQFNRNGHSATGSKANTGKRIISEETAKQVFTDLIGED